MMLQHVVEFIRRRTDIQPKIALILGSGLGALAESVESATVIPTTELAGYPRSTVEGHQGRLVFGTLENAPVVVVQGRVHLYEGHSAHTVGYPVRLAHALGARRLLVTNAAGGIHEACRPGTLMFIVDHLNLVGAMNLVGANPIGSNPATQAAGEVWACMNARPLPYDAAWTSQAEAAAAALGIRTTRGVYAWTRGPSYETGAEIAAFRRMGADAVGMSTVPEVVQASSLGMRVLGISTITNRAAGLSRTKLSHEDVLRVGSEVRGDLEMLIRRLLSARRPIA